MVFSLGLKEVNLATGNIRFVSPELSSFGLMSVCLSPVSAP